MLKGAAKTLVANTTQIHPRSLTRPSPSASRWVKRTIVQNPPKFNKTIILNVEPVSTIFYAEYQNTGPGADVSQRVKWAGYKPTLTDGEAGKFTVQSFIQGPEWLPNAAVQFDSTL